MVRKDIAQTRADLAQWHQQSAELHLQQEKNNRDIAVFEEREKAIKEKKLDIERRITRLEEESNAQQELFHDLNKEMGKKKENFIRSTQVCDSAKNKLEERQKKRQWLENEIGSMRLDIEKLEMRNVQIDVQVEELDRRISTNDNNKRSISLNHEKELQDLEDNNKNLKLNQATLDQLDKKVNDTKEKIKSCNNEMDDLEVELKKIQEWISQEKARSYLWFKSIGGGRTER
jgi:chromosome segregation ATPase